eukprot:2293448-Amphidinium_carterae.1
MATTIKSLHIMDHHEQVLGHGDGFACPESIYCKVMGRAYHLYESVNRGKHIQTQKERCQVIRFRCSWGGKGFSVWTLVLENP